MDQAIERRRGPGMRSVVVVAVITLVAALAYALITRSQASRLRIDPTRTIATRVENGEFREYFPFDGRVEPETTVYLDIEEGGRVDQIFAEGGQWIEKGEPILRFSNATLQRNSIDTETRLIENLDALRTTQFNRAQNALLLKDQLLDLDYRILDLEKTYQRYSELMRIEQAVLSAEAFERARDELDYLRDKRALLKERIAQEDLLSQQQLAQANESIARLDLSLELLTEMVASLEVRAPISGFLSSIDAEIGQNINRGQRIGQIDRLDTFKVRVDIDQYYISKVEIGTPGKFDLDGRTYQVRVSKIHPEVVNDAFSADVALVGEVPEGLRRGQRLTIEMSFGEPTEQLIVARGGFIQRTGGRWAYLIAEDRRSASRTPIRLGRQNPRYVEVLEGLRPGDWIISSGYEAFNDVDELSFTQPIELSEQRDRMARTR